MTLTLGQHPPRHRRRGLIVGLAILLVAAIVAAYAWSIGSVEPGLPDAATPKLDVGRPPPPVPVPGDPGGGR
jgi:hypothetical protein